MSQRILLFPSHLVAGKLLYLLYSFLLLCIDRAFHLCLSPLQMWAGCCLSRLCLSFFFGLQVPVDYSHCYLLPCSLSQPSFFSFSSGCSFCSHAVPLQPLQLPVNVWQGGQPGAGGALIQALACLSWGHGPPVQPQHKQLSLSWDDALALLMAKVWTPTANGSRISPPFPSPPSQACASKRTLSAR